uniref:C-type lectin domain-containing protein n=1 Tax=Acrobeloides nanus TaxID=290746 RepID=A0A914D6F7_9BILA
MHSNSNKCYKYNSQNIIPDDSTCFPTYLLAIESEQENDEIRGLTAGKEAWIGLIQDPFTGNISWHNDSPLNYTNLGPNCTLAEGSGSYFYMTSNGTWRNCLGDYNNISGYFCGAKYGGVPTCPKHGCPSSQGLAIDIHGTVNPCLCYYFTSQKIQDFDQNANLKCILDLRIANSTFLSIDSSFANNELTTLSRQIIKGTNCTFYYNGLLIGITDGFKGEWINGDNSTYRNWHPGYPDILGDSGAVFDIFDGTWSNPENPPDSGYCFICQYILQKRIA